MERYYRPLLRRWLPRWGEILEVGAGAGKFSRELVQLNPHCWITDISKGMLCANPVQGFSKRVADVERLPFADGRFDCCVGVTMFSYLPEKRQGMREIARVLVPGGRVILIDQNRASWLFALTRLHKRPMKNVPQWRESNLPTYVELMREAGMEVLKSGWFTWIPHGFPRWAVWLLRPWDAVMRRLTFLESQAMRFYVVGWLCTQKPATQ